VNIGCGLDTTFDRIDNGLLTWYDLDLPDVIALRQKFIPESDRRTYIRSSFLEDGWLGEIKTGDGVLFIAAGVFYYFEAEQVRGFLKKLADRFPGAEVLFDASSPQGIKTANRLVIKSAGLDERSFLKWGLSHPRDLLAWDKRFKVLKTMYYFRDRRLPLRARMIGLISDLLKIQYMVHLGLGKDS
jgi:O-methyltransferase involved in polyketide biosynthesis